MEKSGPAYAERARSTDAALESDGDFNSIYGSDVESLPGYESDEERQQRGQLTLISYKWTTHAKSQSSLDLSSLTIDPKPSLCVVCGVKPQFSKGDKHYPTCGLTCAAKLEAGGSTSMCVICGVRPSYSKGGKKYPTCGLSCADQLKASGGSSRMGGSYTTGRSGMCVVCGVRPAYSEGGKNYPTCGLSCADKLKANSGSYPTGSSSSVGSLRLMCVICGIRPSYSNGTRKYPTCGLTCAEKLAFGGGPHNMCEYCHRNPKSKNYPHCGLKCKQNARVACLICRSRPKNGKYHFCGRNCRDIAMETSPLLVEARADHVTFEMVEAKFRNAWRASTPCPQVKRVYKIVESSVFLRPYDIYRSKHGNEVFRYHGTNRRCRLGDSGQTTLCNSSSCPACCILKSSFNVSLADPAGAFGQGIYTSSAANKAASFSSSGIMFLNKVVLGKVRDVSQFEAVKSCPLGYQSVVFDRMNGTLNETIVYRNDAIRPVFLIVFG